ncbi:MAG: hypothetical protein AAF485_14085 [Chloroflexota bacterium]
MDKSSSQYDELEQQYQAAQNKIALLEQKTESQAQTFQEQTQRLHTVENELAQAQAALARLSNVDERLDFLKQELLQTIEDKSNSQTKTPEINQIDTVQLDGQTKALNEIQRELDKIRRNDDQLALTRGEVERLNTTITTFDNQLTELRRTLETQNRTNTDGEEQRRGELRYLTEIQIELPKLQRKLETNLSKIQTLEQRMPQFGKYELGLKDVHEEIRRHREYMDFQMAQRERQMKTWIELSEGQERRMDEYSGLIEKYAEHYQLNKRALASLQEFQERLQREQHQAQELYRLAEDRQRVSLERWQGDYEQKWQRQALELAPHQEELNKQLNTLQEQFDKLTQSNQALQQQVDLVLQIMEEDLQARAASTESWQRRFEEIASEQG